ncbi:MAG TPA: DUF3089 domain-containing protein [Croceibacterium sp.]|nr:DUF3089 domain-containing protein [Croceibacterium sp.]
MVRKFLYAVTIFLVLLIVGAFALRLWGEDLAEVALVPSTEFVDQASLEPNAYRDPAMWFAHPEQPQANNPARWQPEGGELPAEDVAPFALFFVHPTSYLERAQWNAPLGDAQSQQRARMFLRGLASPFAGAAEIWAPRYRQATFGAFLTERPEGQRALDAAYRDVALAFDYFAAHADQDLPIVLAGHSQGALHLIRLLQEKVAGTPLQDRVAVAYAVGWPISIEHDLPALGLPACETAEQAACLMSWSSFAEPAEPGRWLLHYRESPGLDGQPRGDSAILCTNPVTGTIGGRADAPANLGTLKPNADLSDGELIPAAVPARCDPSGLLLIGDPPDLGPYVLPGNNYHVYDIPLFWRNVRQDVTRRLGAWTAR